MQRALAEPLAAFGLESARVEPIPVGLIHRSFAVSDAGVEYVLQRVSDIFAPAIHENIDAVTRRLEACGLETLRIVPTRAGGLYAELGAGGRWRLLTRIPGVGFERCASAGQAAAASALVARFHGALWDLEFELRPMGMAWHDTDAHLRALSGALAECAAHPLWGEVEALAQAVHAAFAALPPAPDVPLRIIHGDLKFNNLLFAGAEGAAAERAVAVIDLDTLVRLPLWMELGDAWRSWCNRAGEDEPEAEYDRELFRVALEAYLDAGAVALDAAERASLGDAVERMALELAARFAADALRESYFGWDAERFESSGHHNLVRARGQLDVARQARAASAALFPGGLGVGSGVAAGVGSGGTSR
jgi:Ser/Thr protein kinase RdoA (MazF antagonist)